MRNFKLNTISVRALLIVSACALLGACVEVGIPAGEQPWGELNPLQGMHSSPSFKAQEAQPNFKGGPPSMRVPPPATVPAEFRHYAYANAPEEAGAALKNPVPINAETLRYGKLAYETTCIVCHGADGSGQGYVVGPNKYPNPPSLLTQRAQGFSDGQIYHVITYGQARMWSYKSQLRPLERWAVVNYVRALQRARNPEPQDQKLVNEN
jgi:mono/diheme cytochrome c family protein